MAEIELSIVSPDETNIGPYDARRASFDWSVAKKELGYEDNSLFNIAYFCVDRNCERGLSGKTALIWESNEGEERKYTYDQMRLYSNAFAKKLTELGVKPGDRVSIYLDRIPALYFAFFGILKIGAIAMPMFSAFGEDSLEVRLADAEACAIITSAKLVKRVRKVRENLPALKNVIVVDGEPSKVADNETFFDVESSERVDNWDIFPADFETPSVLHYTSGTTGQPKGALHVHNAIFGQHLTTKWVLDLRPDDIYWCTADPGWVTGISYGVIGPWSIGVTQVVLEVGFIPARWYAAIEKHRVTVWYSAPTAIRLLMRDSEPIIPGYDLSSLRHLCSVGEPLNPEAVVWAQKVYGKPFHDTWWQTETGAIMITNFPGMKIYPGSMGKPFPGVTVGILDDEYKEMDGTGKAGKLALKPPWPSMFRQYWRSPEKYESKFINGWYITGDRARLDENGYYWFEGRDDDVINTGGHLVAPFEVESALLEHEAVAESAAIGTPDPVNMEVVKAYISLKPGFEASKELELKIMNFIRKKLSPFAMPQYVEFVDSLPKTRSGKIMRRVLRAMDRGEPVGDLSTLEQD
ncbi:MAG: acetate--CoA ligase [bacterium]